MITFPNCKINLGLHVVGRRADGYHDLETIFLPVTDMCDELEIQVCSGECIVDSAREPMLPTTNYPLPTMLQEGIMLDNAPDDNICLRAWRLLHDEYGIPPVAIRKEKKIPFGAGLGGGSSDAAFTLKMLNGMFALGLDDAALERLAARLGADCAFFVKNRPAFATGIGDRLEPLDLDLGGYRIAIEIPEGEHVSTKEAYAGIGERLKVKGERVDLREALKRPVGEWRDLIVNDFEESVFAAHPAIAELKAEMYRRGAVYASMTGSGAAVFGIFKGER